MRTTATAQGRGGAERQAAEAAPAPAAHHQWALLGVAQQGVGRPFPHADHHRRGHRSSVSRVAHAVVRTTPGTTSARTVAGDDPHDVHRGTFGAAAAAFGTHRDVMTTPMTTPMTTVRPGTPMKEAAALLAGNGSGQLRTFDRPTA